jgi:hypothetical protein
MNVKKRMPMKKPRRETRFFHKGKGLAEEGERIVKVIFR